MVNMENGCNRNEVAGKSISLRFPWVLLGFTGFLPSFPCARAVEEEKGDGTVFPLVYFVF